MRVIVTGGAGYIGAHMVLHLVRQGAHVTVVDDLSTGHAEQVPAGAELVVLDVGDEAAMRALLTARRAEAVIHFAGRIQVGESMSAPRKYWRDNLETSRRLLEAVLDAQVPRFIFSSTAAVYGVPARVPIPEDEPTCPVNPYGETKLALERMLATYAAAYGLQAAALRYFNAAGAEPGAGLAERHDPETHLIPIVLEAARGRRRHVSLFGDDYPTPDGTCVRDYIHVMDLARAHQAALEHLQRGGRGGAFNLGTGRGHSVREVIQVAERVTGRTVPVHLAPRRAGDPPVLVASPRRAEEELGWRAERSSLEQIVADAWAAP